MAIEDACVNLDSSKDDKGNKIARSLVFSTMDSPRAFHLTILIDNTTIIQ